MFQFNLRARSIFVSEGKSQFVTNGGSHRGNLDSSTERFSLPRRPVRFIVPRARVSVVSVIKYINLNTSGTRATSHNDRELSTQYGTRTHNDRGVTRTPRIVQPTLRVERVGERATKRSEDSRRSSNPRQPRLLRSFRAVSINF